MTVMNKKLVKVTTTIFLVLFVFLLSSTASAHGIVDDGHDGPLRPIDYIELGGVAVGSLVMIIYSFDQWRKEKRKK